jgi:putative flippase GtrA
VNIHYTFQSNKRHREALTKFMVVAVLAFFMNALFMYGFATALQWHYLLAQVLTTGLVFLWTFLANLLWSFRE